MYDPFIFVAYDCLWTVFHFKVVVCVIQEMNWCVPSSVSPCCCVGEIRTTEIDKKLLAK